jgi:hypothetical protein
MRISKVVIDLSPLFYCLVLLSIPGRWMLSAALSAGMAWRTKAWDRRRLVDVVPGCQGFRGKGAALVVVGWFGMVHARNPICKCSSWGFCRSLRLHDPPVISSAEERYPSSRLRWSSLFLDLALRLSWFEADCRSPVFRGESRAMFVQPRLQSIIQGMSCFLV